MAHDAFEEFSSEYGDLASDALRVSYKNFSMRLADWLDFIDGSLIAAPVVDTFRDEVDFDAWYAAGVATGGSLVGSASLDWSRDRTKRLAQTLGLVRHLAADQMAFADFNAKFLWAGSAFAEGVAKIQTEILEPFFRDFLKHVARQVKQAGQVPASDRIVTLDHNAPNQRSLDADLERVEAGMQESNSLRSDADFDRNLAELSAARRLLKASSVRLFALAAVLSPVLAWLGHKTLAGTMSVAVAAVIAAVATMFGIHVPGL